MDTMKPKKFLFVLMPFHSDFDDTYKYGIKQTCDQLGAYCERVDEQIFTENILDRILNQIVKADILIADMTGKNANVFYEVGYAHGIGRKVILLTQNADDIPFDFKHFPHIIYGKSIQELGEKLKRKLEFFLAEPNDPDVNFLYNFNLEVFFNGQKIEKNTELIFDPGVVSNYEYVPKFDLFNNSNRILRNKISIGIEANSSLEDLFYGFQTIKLPLQKTLFLSKDVSLFYPNGWKNVVFKLKNTDLPAKGKSFDAIFKIFSPHETIEIPIKLTFQGYNIADWL